MSTKAIRAVLKYLKDTNQWVGMCADAASEVEAIQKAATVLEAEDVGGAVYTVRDRAAEDTSFTGNTWEHPRVVAYGEAAQVITNIAKESNT